MKKKTITAMRKSLEDIAPLAMVTKELCGPSYRVFDGKRYTQTAVPRTCVQPGNNKRMLKEFAQRRYEQYRIVETHDICPYRYMLYTRT